MAQDSQERAQLRLAKAARKEAARTRREAHRRRNIAIAELARVRRSSGEGDSAAVSAAMAAAEVACGCADPSWLRQRNSAERGRALELCTRIGNALQASVLADELAASDLLHRMRKGLPYETTTAARVGYARRKFRARAMLVYDCCVEIRRLATIQPTTAALASAAASSLATATCVVSLGGGPANDLCGYVAHESALAERGKRQLSAAKLWCLDSAVNEWSTLVSAADAALGGGRVRSGHVDLTRAVWPPPHLGARVVAEVASASLFIFSYVLIECRGRWASFVDSLWRAARPGALLLLTEPTDWQLREVLDVLSRSDPPCRVEDDALWLDVRAAGAAPSALLIARPAD